MKNELFTVYYPTTTPVGIVSINDAAQDRLLLIRQPRYPPGMYSCIAGFLDVGETLEDCVKREAAEEVGIEVTKVRYFTSICSAIVEKMCAYFRLTQYIMPIIHAK